MSEPKAPAPAPTEEISELEALLVRWTVPLFPAVVVVAAGIMGAIRGAPGAVLVLAGGMLVVVIAAFWRSIRVLVGEAPLSLEATLWHGQSPQEDEKKQAVLRALKDLEYERSVGKLGDEDYKQLSARYRGEAKALLRAQDEALAPAREKAELLIAKKLAGEPLDPVDPDTVKPGKKRKKRAGAVPDEASVEARACPACKTENDGDAKFCKSCGGKL